MLRISIDSLKQYGQIFGQEKMRRLWLEFTEDAKQKLNQAENGSKEEQRLAFHSLRSSSLVFGMTSFSAFCQKTEEEILNGNPAGKETLSEARKLLMESMAEVEAYLA